MAATVSHVPAGMSNEAAGKQDISHGKWGVTKEMRIIEKKQVSWF